MQWLSEIYGSTSDQARLVTTLIAAVIAIVVVFINQGCNSRRARKEKLIEKLEELYSLVLNLQELHSAIHAAFMSTEGFPKKEMSPAEAESNEFFKKVDEMHFDIMRKCDKVHMLSGLYFPEAQAETVNAKQSFIEISLLYGESESISEYLEDYKDYKKDLDESLSNILKVLSSKIDSTMH